MSAITLSTLFSDIANAIRSKTGGTEKMTPAEFPEKIEAIIEEYDGTISITEDHSGGGQD